MTGVILFSFVISDVVSKDISFRGPKDCLVHLHRTQGLRSCYTGLLPMALRDIPGYGIYILAYEWTYRKITELNFGDRQGFLASVLAGGWAGAVSWGVIVPLDVIKSLIQADITRGNFYGFTHCVTSMYRQRGLNAFYAGFLITTLRGFPQGCITFLVYSQLLKVLNGNF